MGCAKGNLYVFDPALMAEGKIHRFYHSKPPCQKKKKIEMVKWLEPISLDKYDKFLAVFEDGTFQLIDTRQYPI